MNVQKRYLFIEIGYGSSVFYLFLKESIITRKEKKKGVVSSLDISIVSKYIPMIDARLMTLSFLFRMSHLHRTCLKPCSTCRGFCCTKWSRALRTAFQRSPRSTLWRSKAESSEPTSWRATPSKSCKPFAFRNGSEKLSILAASPCDPSRSTMEMWAFSSSSTSLFRNESLEEILVLWIGLECYSSSF